MSATPTQAPRLLPFDRAARAVGRNGQTLRNWHRRGYIRAYRSPSRRGLLVDLNEVQRAMRTQPPSRIPRRTASTPRGPVVTLTAGSAS